MMIVKSVLALVLLALSLFGQTAETPVVEAEEVPVFRTGINLVRVDAEVTSGAQAVHELKAEDFVVYDEGERRPIGQFESETEPVKLMLLLDVSGSMRRKLGDLSERAADALIRLRNADEVAVMLFASENNIVQPLTTDFKSVPGRVVSAVFKGSLGRGTQVNEALLAAAKYLTEQSPKGRKAIVVVTDNETSMGAVRNADVLNALQRGDIVLNAILFGDVKPERGRNIYTDPQAATLPDVAQYARSTGGVVISDAKADQALGEMMSKIVTRYSFQFAAPESGPGAYRKIRVELTPDARLRFPDTTIRAREGYIAAEGQP